MNFTPGNLYHVYNQGNNHQLLFRDRRDYLTFLSLYRRLIHPYVNTIAWTLMPNHFHLVLWPRGDGDLSRWMQWLLTAHVRRYHRHYGGSGHVWQGRFKAFPIQLDEHLLAVLSQLFPSTDKRGACQCQPNVEPPKMDVKGPRAFFVIGRR